MKILYVITGLGLGGAETITVNVAAKVAQRGHEVRLVSLGGENGHFGSVPGVEIIRLGMDKTPAGFIRAERAMVRLLREWKPDAVHANMFHAIVFCRAARLFARVPLLVSTDHSMEIENPVRRLAYRLTDFLSDVNTNVSEAARDYFVDKGAFSAKKSVAVHNGIDLCRFARDPETRAEMRQEYGIPEGSFAFVNVGRLVPVKDQKSLVEIIARLVAEGADARLFIVGDGPLREDLRALALSLGVQDRVTLPGPSRAVERFYNLADCFVLSSVTEGFGLVLAEAMACSLPVVSTDSGGCREVVGDASVIAMAGAIDDLHKKMKAVLEMSPARRRAMGDANAIKAARFGIDRAVDSWIGIYEKGNHTGSPN